MSKPDRGKAADAGQEIEHQANTNQVRHEPVPASRHDQRRPAAVVRNEESATHSAASGTRHQDAREWDDDQDDPDQDQESG